MALDALPSQGAVDCKSSIEPSLLDDDDGEASARPRLRLPLQVGKSRQKRREVASRAPNASTSCTPPRPATAM